MSRMARLLVPLLLLALGGCSRVHIRSDYDPAADFSGLRTYAWAPDPRLLNLHPLVRSAELDGRIRSTIDRELSRRGYEQGAAGEPDFLVRYLASIRRTIGSETVWEPSSYQADPDGTLPRTAGFAQTYTHDYRAGSFIIDVLKPGRKDPIWRGTAEAVLNEAAPPEERRARLDASIRRILEKFPPR